MRRRSERQLHRIGRTRNLLPELGQLRARQQLQLAAGPRSASLPDLRQHDVVEEQPSGEVRRRVRAHRRGRLLGLLRSGARVPPVAGIPGEHQPGAPGALRTSRRQDSQPGGSQEAAGRGVPRRDRRSIAAVLSPGQREGQQQVPLLRAGQLEGDAVVHLQLRHGMAARDQRAQLRSVEAGVSRADLRQRPRPDAEGVQELLAGSRIRLVARQGSADGHPRRRRHLLRYAAWLVAPRRARRHRRLGASVHRERRSDQSADRPAVQHRFSQLARAQLRRVPAAARAAGREVSRHRRPAADPAVEAGDRARRAVPARIPDRERAPLQHRVPARAHRRDGAADRPRVSEDDSRHAGRLLRRERRLQPLQRHRRPGHPALRRRAGQRSGGGMLVGPDQFLVARRDLHL